MATINETKLREALLERNLCDADTAVAIAEVCQELWSEATADFATEDKIAAAVAELRSALLEALQESERLQVERHEALRREFQEFRVEISERDERLRREFQELRAETSERDDRLRREIAARDAGYRDDQANRDRRMQWLIGLGFTAFGVLASVLAVFT